MQLLASLLLIPNQTQLKLRSVAMALATERREVVLKRPGQNGEFSSQPEMRIYLAIEIKCIGPVNNQQAMHIMRVSVRDNDGLLGDVASRDFYELPEGETTPTDEQLRQVYTRNGRRPFLVSISTRAEYTAAISVILDSMPDIDVPLANILLSELNATCSTQEEGNRIRRQRCREALPPLRRGTSRTSY